MEFLREKPQEALYIAAVLCGDAGAYHEDTLRQIAGIVTDKSAKDIAAASRSELCNMLYKVSPWTWTTKRVGRGLTGIASKLKLTGPAILRRLVMRFNDLRYGDKYARAAFDAQSFNEFKGRLSGPITAEDMRSITAVLKRVKALFVEMQSFVKAESRFSLLRGAAWFGELSETQKKHRAVLFHDTEVLMNKLERYAFDARMINVDGSPLAQRVTELQVKLRSLEAKVAQCCEA